MICFSCKRRKYGSQPQNEKMYKKGNRNRVHGSLRRGAISPSRMPVPHTGDPLHRTSLQIKDTDGIQTHHASWGRRSAHGPAACSGSTRAPTMSPGGSHATSGQPRRLVVVSIVHDGLCACALPRLLTVVALLALGAVTAHVAEATARIARGLAGAAVSTLAPTVPSTAAVAALLLAVAAALRAVAGNVALLAALVALLAARSAATATHLWSAVLGAFARDVAGSPAAVARLLGLGGRALAANVTLLAAVVAGRGSLGRALGSAVRAVATCSRVSQSTWHTCCAQRAGQQTWLAVHLQL